MKQDDKATISLLSGLKNIWPVLLGIIFVCGFFAKIQTDLEIVKTKLDSLPEMTKQITNHENRITKLETMIEIKKEK